ncbi:MAG: queuosine precursor transporter [Sphaerochaeta sp.]|nr:queuosine precursor transporter [Sphaerochaeta sp.]MDD3929571.1 queuosine precursor transporter [Sphaerochaeta sp.]NCC13286.1 VUT family protein [Spirochaetia bacterium]NCC89659.1 VUT family protein [Spirochaetia bacterium]
MDSQTSGMNRKELFLFALYITGMIVVNTVGSKIISLFGVRVSVGIFFMPVLFLVTDIVGEVKGHEHATLFVRYSIIMLVILFAVTGLFIKIAPHPSWQLQEQYQQIFGMSMRMSLASLVSFAVSQTVDVNIFLLFKKLSNGRMLWLRNNLSTMTSQFIDTVIFMFIAFYHMTPTFTAAYVFSLIIPYWLFKVLFALIDTPFCYLGVQWLKKER